MGVHRVELADEDPEVHGAEVGAEHERPAVRGNGEDEHLERVRVGGGDAERRRVVVVDLVDVLVEDTPVEAAVQEVLQHVLDDEERQNLHGHRLAAPRRQASSQHGNGSGSVQ